MKAHSGTHKHVCLLGGSGSMPPPRKFLNLDPLRLLLTQSGPNFPNNILMTHTNHTQFQDFWEGRKLWLGGIQPHFPPLYETLTCMQIFSQKTYLDSGQQLLDLKTEILIFHQTLLSITHCLLQNKGDIAFTIQMSPSQHKKCCSNFELHWFAAYPGTAALS